MINFVIFLSMTTKYDIFYNIDDRLENCTKIQYKHNDCNLFEILNTSKQYGNFSCTLPEGKIEIILECDTIHYFYVSLKGKNILCINNIKTNIKNDNKDTILLIIDSYGWAFDNIAKNIKKNTYRYDVSVITYPYLHEIIKNNNVNKEIKQVNHILFFWYAAQNLEILDYFYNNKGKHNIKTINLCIYDYSKWINTNDENDAVYRQGITYFFDKIDNYLYGCNFIRQHVEQIFKDRIQERNICGYQAFDGVDIKMFPYFGYGKNLFTKKKLIVGWIGNSNPTVHGINKGFDVIKKCIDDMDDKFIFLPLDIYTSNKVIKHENVHCYLSLVDIIVSYSKFEGTPNQILEASSSGKCWISTNVGIVNELQNTIKDKQCGITINRIEEELKNALLTFYYDRNMMIEYGNNGRYVIEKKWSWEENAKQFYNFFDIISKTKNENNLILL